MQSLSNYGTRALGYEFAKAILNSTDLKLKTFFKKIALRYYHIFKESSLLLIGILSRYIDYNDCSSFTKKKYIMLLQNF